MADRVFGGLAKGAAIFTLVMLAAILASLTASAWPAIDKYGLGFLTSTTWDPVKEDFGGLVMVYGTLMTSFIALLIACLLYTSPSPRDRTRSRMPSSA